MMPARRSVLAQLLALGAAAAAATSGAAPPPDKRLALRRVVQGHVVYLPTPTWRDKPLVPKVVPAGHGLVLLNFPPRPHRLHGTADPFTTRVEFLRGIRDVADARAHYRLADGIDLEKYEREPGNRPIVPLDLPWGRAFTIDLGRLGWAPGNVYHYCLLAKPWPSALFIGPTDYVAFDLPGMTIERDAG
jgi:hypothetical protein